MGPISLAEILTPERVRCNADATSKKKALEMLSELMASTDDTLPARTVADRLMAREKLGSTALGYGIITCENEAQAWARAKVDEKDKGGDAARACLDMVEIKRHFRLYPR